MTGRADRHRAGAGQVKGPPNPFGVAALIRVIQETSPLPNGASCGFVDGANVEFDGANVEFSDGATEFSDGANVEFSLVF